MDNQQHEALKMSVEQDIEKLQKEVKALRGKQTPFTSAVTSDPFSRIKELNIESGTTGSARYRRIPLFSDLTTGTSVSTTEGSFDAIQHTRLADGATDVVFYTPVILPTDFVRGGFPTLNYIYSNDVTSGNVLWVLRVVSIVDTAAAETAILSDSTVVTVGGVADVMAERSVKFTVIPERSTTLAISIQRTGADGDDTSTGISSVWTAWVTYLAHS